ncbi:MAG: acetolactate synthase small subunit [Acutalibacteraceae bacterium]|nr:acetolactate synthase small subunit [Acutalibacteraceae bacterium]
MEMMKKFIIGMLVENKFGVLNRISGMFSRRGFNIDSLTVGVTENEELSRMTVTMTGDDYARDQMIKQLSKIQEVREIKQMNSDESVIRELVILKVKTTSENRHEVMDAINVFHAKITDYSPTAICLEITGETAKLDAFIEIVRPFGIIEMCRTGAVAMQRGNASLKE